MAAHRPVYTYEIRRPRSLNDATESLLLVPPAGAPHADECKFSSAPVAGYLPIADEPDGMRGELDPLEATMDKGQFRVRILDVKTPHGDNAKRWFTAFLHDANGREQALGGLFVVRESLDGGTTFADFAVGRLEDYDCPDGRNEVTLTVRDLSEDLDVDVFVDRPHSSITYAVLQRLAPVGLHVAYGDFPLVPKFRGTVRQTSGILRFGNPLVFPTGGVPLEHTVATAALADHLETTEDAAGGSSFGNIVASLLGGWGFGTESVRVVAKRLDTNATGEFKARAIWLKAKSNESSRLLVDVAPEPLEVSHPKYMAVPPAGTLVEWELYSTRGPSRGAPIVIGPVHPVQLFADLLDGKFGYLNDAGAVTRSVQRDSTSFTALLADPSFGTITAVVEERDQLNDWIEDHLCKEHGFAYSWNASGRVVVHDTRVTSSPGALVTITDDDLVDLEEGVGWSRSRRGAITRVDAAVTVDQYFSLLVAGPTVWGRATQVAAPNARGPYPDIPGHLFSSVEVPVKLNDLGGRALDYGEKKVRLSGRTFRAAVRDAVKGLPAVEQAVQRVYRRTHDLKAPFASGPMEYTLLVHRGSNGDCQPGELRYLRTSFIVNPYAAQRMTPLGVARLVRAVARADKGPAIAMSFVDLAQGETSAVPTVTLAAVDRQTIDITVTRNAQNDPVVVELAVTESSVGTAPAETSALWTFVAVRETNGTFRISRLASGKKVWVRARSQVGAGERQVLPSAWVASSPASVTLASLTAPSGLTATQTTTTSTFLQWTNGESDCELEIFVTTGGTPATWDKVTDRIAALPAGTTRYTLRGLNGPSAAHTVGIRHRDQSGGVSSMTTVSVTTDGSSAKVAPPMGGKVPGGGGTIRKGFTVHRSRVPN